MQTDRRLGRRTDMTKLIVAFRNFANSPNNQYSFYVSCQSAVTRISNCVFGNLRHSMCTLNYIMEAGGQRKGFFEWFSL